MKKVPTERDQIRDVAARWRGQYGHGTHWAADPKKQDIQRQLDHLDVETASPSIVASIIGNDSWVAPATCNECGAKGFDMVVLGEPPDYESRTATVCAKCLAAALAVANKVD